MQPNRLSPGKQTLVEMLSPPASPPPVTAMPALGLQRATVEPAVYGGVRADGEALRAAIVARDAPRIMAILARNASPESMAALCQAAGPGIANRLELILNGAEWARARAYLGEQVALDRQLATHDKDAIFRDLQQLSDRRALELCCSSTATGTVFQPPESGAAQGAAGHSAPATLGAVQEVLRGKLEPDDYARAMRLLLDKAERAQKASHAAPVPPPGTQPGDFTVRPGDLRVNPADPTGGVIALIGGGRLDPVSAARVDLAEERIRAADARGSSGEAYLGLADLDADERKALALRLADKPLAKTSDLAALASETDDATAIHAAILHAQYAASITQQAAAGADLEAAIARIGDLVRTARMRLALLPPSAPEAERQQAQDELVRLEQMFFGDRAESLQIRAALETATRGDPRAYAEQLRALGADPVTVGRELLGRVRAADVDGLIDVLALIPAPHRIAALEAADRLGDLSAPWLPPDKRELLAAYVEQGRRHVPHVPVDPSVPVLELPATVTEPSPDATIALFEILAAMDRGPTAAHAVLARLERLSAADHAAVVAEPRFEAKLQRLPSGDRDEVDFKRALTNAKGGVRETQLEILQYPSGFEAPGQRVQLEAIRIKTEEAGGPAALRRAYVLVEQLAADPQRAARLSPKDVLLLERFHALAAHKPTLDTDAQRVHADEIMLGQPQLTDTPEAPLDPNTEAEYMRLRLRKAAKIPAGKPLAEWPPQRPEVTEALTRFEALYTEARPAGVSRGHLAQLAELYYRATHALEDWNRALAENESLAQLASMVAGVVVAVVVTAATGGALGPVALAALAGISAGTASAISGAAVRWEDTPEAALKDFGAGAVEGVAMVAGAGLASKIVRGTSAGLSAAQAGGHAAQVGGRVAAQVAESAIDGAVGGAAGELFQTAVDEATWDRGVARALAAMLAALARGGAIGGAAGGAVGGLIGGLGRLATRSGDDVAHGVGHLLDASGVGRRLADDLADPAQDELAHAFQLIESGRLDEAERVLHGIAGLPAKARVMLIEAARGRAAVRSSGGVEAIDLDGEAFWPRIVDAKQFKALAGGQRADAVVIIEGGKPQIIARRGASPSAIREEVIHLHQWHGDLAMRQKMERLGEDRLGQWGALEPQAKLQLHIDKLQIEADAQRRLIAQLEHAAGADPEAAMRLMDAEETLFLLGQRLDTLQGAGRAGAAIDLAQLGIEDPPRLYARGAQSPVKITGWRASRARRAFVDQTTSIDDPGIAEKLTRQGYRVHRDRQTGEIFRIARQPERSAELPHLQIKGDRTIGEGEGVPTFAERKARAADEWTATGEDLRSLEQQLASGTLGAKDAQEARVYLQSKGPRVRAELERRVARGDLDEGTAGLVAKWGAVVERLESDAAAGTSTQLTPFTIGEFLGQVPKGPLSEAQNDQLRRYLRERTLQYIEALERPKDRMDALQQMLDVQPDAGSKGELFHAYRERFMGAATNEEGRALYEVAAGAPGKFRGAGLDRPRTPDGVVNVKLQPDVERHLPPGKYAVEDKAGQGAFKLDQAQDYARRAYEKAGGFKLTPHAKEVEYVGLVYVFSRKSEAKTALKRMARLPEIEKLLGRHPAGIHVMFFDADTGTLELETSLLYVKKRSS